MEWSREQSYALQAAITAELSPDVKIHKPLWYLVLGQCCKRELTVLNMRCPVALGLGSVFRFHSNAESPSTSDFWVAWETMGSQRTRPMKVRIMMSVTNLVTRRH